MIDPCLNVSSFYRVPAGHHSRARESGRMAGECGNLLRRHIAIKLALEFAE
jgi:hypothetical protein